MGFGARGGAGQGNSVAGEKRGARLGNEGHGWEKRELGWEIEKLLGWETTELGKEIGELHW